MAAESNLREEIRTKVDEIGSADILVGIPSYNNAKTIGRVVQAVSAGLAKYFPEAKALLVNSDGGSMDDTRKVVAEANHDHANILLSHRVNALNKISSPYHGIPGKGSAFRMIFEIARALKVKACAVVDSDLRSITPEWIELLVRPVYKEGYDYVAPYYLRHKYDGTITNSIVYPMTRSLYGKRIRQPIGGEFGFSGEMAGYFLSKDVWATDVARYGIDIWMTTEAVAKGAKVCQVYLGAKIHDPKDPGADLSAMLAQVTGSLFKLMIEHVQQWRQIRGSEPIPLFGFQYEVGLEPIAVNVDRMLKSFALGLNEFLPIWEGVLSSRVLSGLQEIRPTPTEMKFPDELWVRVIYDFALAVHRNAMTVDHLLKSLTPLYLGRIAHFILENKDSSHWDVENKIETLCTVFEKEKPYLIEQWDQPINAGGES